MAERQNKTYTVFAIDPTNTALDPMTEQPTVVKRTLREVGTSEARSRAEAVEKWIEENPETEATSFWAEANFEPLTVAVETTTKVKVRRRATAAA